MEVKLSRLKAPALSVERSDVAGIARRARDKGMSTNDQSTLALRNSPRSARLRAIHSKCPRAAEFM